MKRTITQDIISWSKNFLEKPNKDLGGKPVCPFAKKTREVDADKYADTLENCCNWYQMCKLQEAKLTKQLQIVKEAKKRLKRKILKNI